MIGVAKASTRRCVMASCCGSSRCEGISYRRSGVDSISVASSTLSIVAFMHPHSFVNGDRHVIAALVRRSRVPCHGIVRLGQCLVERLGQQSPAAQGCALLCALVPRARTIMPA